MTSGVFRTCPPDQIEVHRDERIRKDLDDIDTLADSIRRLGLIHPVVVTRDFVLVAGERRLAAIRSLGWTSIPFQFQDEQDPAILRAIELEENVKRKDMTWQDEARAVADYHEYRKSLETDWSLDKTSAALGITPQLVGQKLAVVREMKSGNARVAEAPKFSTARGIVQRVEERRRAEDLIGIHSEMDLPKPERPPDSIIHADFNEWAPQYSGPPFNFIHCDFPYGIGADKFNQGGASTHGGYTDSLDTYLELLNTLNDNVDRLTGDSAHMIFWFSMQHYQFTLDFLTNRVGFWVNPYPLIWHKTDNSGIIPNPSRDPRQVYETAFFCSKGSRPIVRSVSNTYGCPSQKDIHMSVKPEPMLRYFFGMVIDEYSRVLDPTCGSGGAIRAAEGMGAKLALGLERNEEFARSAQLALEKARRK